MTTSCTDSWRRRVSDYHDGGITGPDRAEIEAHIATCAICQSALASYDRVYRQMRSLPGFEGMLTVTKPGNRRGIGGSARPTFTWPGHSTVGSQRRAGGTGGSIAIALVLLVAIAVVLGRGSVVFTPQSPNIAEVPTPTVIPTMAAKTANGLPCANDEAEYPQAYIYSDANGLIWQVQQCHAPVKVTALPFTDFRLGPVSPDGQNLTIITPAAHSVHAHLYDFGVKSGKLRELSSVSGAATLPTSVQDLAWSDNATMLVLAGGHVYSENVTTTTTTLLPISATKIAWRNQQLFYSVPNQGQLVIHSFDPTSKADSVVFLFGPLSQSCPAGPACSSPTLPWDITPAGDTVVFPATIPTAGGASSGSGSGLYAANLKSGNRTQIASLPVPEATVQHILFAPDGLHVAVQWPDTTPAGAHLKIASIDGGKVLDVPGNDAVAWRPDTNAIVVMPAAVSATNPAQLVLLDASHTLDLPPKTLNYLWLPTN